MIVKIAIASICASMLSFSTFAAPVEFDTPDAHIIVVRALDSWSGDTSASEDSLEAVTKHEGGFHLERPKGFVAGFPLLFGGLNDDIVVQGVNSALKAMNFKLAQSSVNFRVEKPIPIEPTKYDYFVKYEHDFYKNTVLADGNPASLSGRVKAKKFFSGALALVSVALAGEKFGVLGSQTTLGSFSGDIYQLSASSRAALSPVNLPDFDASSYKTIDVRRVTQGNNDRLGQVIIAYKNDKTVEAENTALIKAIVSLTGADTTVDAIKQARAEDLSKRQTIWDACVAEGKCKNE